MKKKNVLVGLAFSGMMMAISGNSVLASSDHASNKMMGECHGVNSCKGSGACGGKGHSCAGKNSCKGKGWIKLSQHDCNEKGGTFKKSSM